MSSIVLYDDMVRAIAECRQIDEVKGIRDKARALAEYMRQAKDREQARKCDEIRLRAEIGAGRLLREQVMAKASPGNQHTGKLDQSNATTSPNPKTLSDLGVSKDQSSKWQQMANAYDEDPTTAEDYLRHDEQPSTAGFLGKVAAPLGGYDESYTKDALWLWGRMHDFHKMMLPQAPSVVVDGMSEQMLKEFKDMLPAVIDWLVRAK